MGKAAHQNSDAPGAYSELERLRNLLLKQEHDDLASINIQLDTLRARVGDNGTFAAALEPVLIETLSRLRETQARDLSRTLAPLVVPTIRAEFRNSREELVNAIYPLTGKMVSSAIRSALAKLSEDINRRVEAASNPQMLMARIKGKATGKPVSTYMMAGSGPAQIVRAILVEKNSGTLVAHWARDGDAAGDADMVGSLIAALTTFAAQTYASRESDLRNVELEGHHLTLRHSPAYLLALDVEGDLTRLQHDRADAVFLDLMDRVENADVPDDAALEHISADITATRAAKKNSKLMPLALLLLVGIIALVGYRQWTIWAFDRQVETVRSILFAKPGLSPYPLRVVGHTSDQRIVVSGLAPPNFDATATADEIAPAIDAETRLDFDISNLSTRAQDLAISDEIGRETTRLTAALDSMETETRQRLSKLEAQAGDTSAALRERLGKQNSALQTLTVRASALSELMDESRSDTDTREMQMLERVRQLQRTLTSRLGETEGAVNALSNRIDTRTSALTDAAASFETSLSAALAANLVEAQRGAAKTLDRQTRPLTASIKQQDNTIAALQQQVTKLAAVVTSERAQRMRLDQQLLETAEIAFSRGADYRAPAQADTMLTMLAAAIMRLERPVTISGHTDISGNEAENRTSGLVRAEAVKRALFARGVDAALLQTATSGSSQARSDVVGAGSPERRVTFAIDG